MHRWSDYPEVRQWADEFWELNLASAFANRSRSGRKPKKTAKDMFKESAAKSIATARMWYDLFDDCWVLQTYKKSERRDGDPVWPEKPLEAARTYIEDFLFRHPASENVAYKGLWGDLQLLDSSIMEEAMHRCNLRGIPVLSVHDELVVQRTKKEEVRQILVSSFHKVTKSKFVGFTPNMSWSEK